MACVQVRVPLIVRKPSMTKDFDGENVELIFTNDLEKDAEMLISVLGREELPKNVCEKDLSNASLQCQSQWTRILRPYFENPEKEAYPPTVLVRKQLERRQMSSATTHDDSLAIWEDDAPWKENPRIKRVIQRLLALLPVGSIAKFEDVSRLVPFILHIAEDCTLENRLIGTVAIENCIKAVQPKLLVQMQLDDLFFKILLLNISFDDFDLKQSSIQSILKSLCELPGRSEGKVRANLEELTEFLIRQIAAARDPKHLQCYLEGLIESGQMLGFGLICYLKSLLLLMIDLFVLDKTGNLRDSTVELLKVVVDNCWPRLEAHKILLKQILPYLLLTESLRESLMENCLIEQIKALIG